MTAFDHYAAAEHLIAELKRAGFADDAEALQNAIEGGSTGTEIFMALSSHLRQILGRLRSDDLRARASELTEEIERALRARD